jgi:membrane protein implicated in regulation of membrane protease activity
VRRTLRNNGLSLFFFAIFVAALIGQAIAGNAEFNSEAIAHGSETKSLTSYIVSADFGQAVMENWQSEYLQFTLFILTTVWLVQRGSPESKKPDQMGTQTDEEQLVGEHAKQNSPRWARARGFRLWLYSNSLLLVMGLIFFGSWFAQSVTGWSEYNAEQIQHEQPPLSWLQYVGSANFWQATLQNWQSEFLAVGSMAVLSIYLRQRGSPESKPVGSPHEATGVEG